MRSHLYVCGFLLLIYAVSNVASLTNAEFYDLVKDYITETVQESNEESVSNDDINDDVIYLPGGPDDQVDIEGLMRQIGDSYIDRDDETSIIEYGKHRSVSRGGCGCGRRYCQCCASKRFCVRAWRRRYSFTLRACVKVQLVRRGFEVSFTLNGRRVLHRRYTLRTGISLCYRVPQFPAAKVCLNLYNINLRRRSMCARLTGKVNLWKKRFRVHLKLGCFRLRAFEEDSIANIDRFSEYLHMVAEKTLGTNYFPRNPDQPNIFTDAIDNLDANDDLDLSIASSDDIDQEDDVGLSDASTNDVESENDPAFSDASTNEVNSKDDLHRSDVSNDGVVLKYDHDSLNAFESE
ncbi:uncharacterized protein LOC132721471 isoform X2 [Ruditapes philippinarum]|uniref:uncharacterized protein LOC132721471 isoform X2 n=1 Tax=Ruditapes philippinarum TaxID=129788 RepID=UPI00295AC050|nr:uncharacterized protein LOC132721471 isoform X2 [Ruditapes philippinarum]